MALELPLQADGDRLVEVDLGSQILQFRTYWTGHVWLMDIADSTGVSLLSGIALLPGINNLLYGQGEGAFGAARLVAVLAKGAIYNADVLGNGLKIYWLKEGDLADFYPVGDPLIGG